MGIISDIGEGLVLASEAPLLAGLGAIALIYPAISWVRKNAAPRLSEQRQARTFQRILDTARGLNELAEMKHLTEEQRSDLQAALIENGKGLLPRQAPEELEAAALDPADDRADPVPPPWFLDRVEALFDAGGRIFGGLFLVGIGVACLTMALGILGSSRGTTSLTDTVLTCLFFTGFGLFSTLNGLQIVTTSIGLHLAFINHAKDLLSKLLPPTWLIFLLEVSIKYLTPVILFAYVLNWALTTTERVDATAWGFTVFLGLLAVGVSVNAIQKLRVLFHIPEAFGCPDEPSDSTESCVST